MLLNQIPFCLSNPSQNRNTLKEKKAQYDFGTHMVPSKRAGESAVQFVWEMETSTLRFWKKTAAFGASRLGTSCMWVSWAHGIYGGV